MLRTEIIHLQSFTMFTKRLRSGRGGDVSELSLGYINHVHSSRLPHVEWGYQPKGLLNAVMITRIGRRLIDVVSDGTLTNERILEDVRAGLTELLCALRHSPRKFVCRRQRSFSSRFGISDSRKGPTACTH
jgi:hypothetical protein